jgi:hypothetical protein
MIPCATNWLMGRRNINFTFSAATNKSVDQFMLKIIGHSVVRDGVPAWMTG